jgi:hypothetical protein
MCRGLPLQVGLGATPPQQPLGAAPSGVSDGIVCPYDDDFLTSTYKVRLGEWRVTSMPRPRLLGEGQLCDTLLRTAHKLRCLICVLYSF